MEMLQIEHHPRKSLSEVCSQLMRHGQNRHETYLDARMFGAPSECYALIDDGLDYDFQVIIDESGFGSFEAILEAARERVTEKWVYENLICL